MAMKFLHLRLGELFEHDEGCYSVARQLIEQRGSEEALRYSWDMVETERGEQVNRWIKIARAVEDINRPEMPYHL